MFFSQLVFVLFWFGFGFYVEYQSAFQSVLPFWYSRGVILD